MRNWLKSLFTRPTRTPACARLAVENLEAREVPAHITAAHVLVIDGTQYHDFVRVENLGWLGGYVRVTENGYSDYFNKSIIEHIKFDGGTGNDTYTNDTELSEYVYGGPGGDTLTGGYGGYSVLHGDEDGDTLTGRNRNDGLDGGAGNDWLLGGPGQSTLRGGVGNDWLYGGEGGDYLNGDQGIDHLYGQGGNDTLNGGFDFDADYLTGGSSPYYWGGYYRPCHYYRRR